MFSMTVTSYLEHGSELAPSKEVANEKADESREADQTPDNLKECRAGGV